MISKPPHPYPLPRGERENGEPVSSIDNPVPRRGPWLAMTERLAATRQGHVSGDRQGRKKGAGIRASGFGSREEITPSLGREGKTASGRQPAAPDRRAGL